MFCVQLEVCDIEQLVTLGRQTKTCPYYGSRLAVPGAEVIAFVSCCLARIVMALPIVFVSCCLARIAMALPIAFVSCCLARIVMALPIAFVSCCLARIAMASPIAFVSCCLARIAMVLPRLGKKRQVSMKRS